MNTIVNLTRYPMADLQSDTGAAFARQCRQNYLANGLCVLPEFILPEALRILAAEADSLTDRAYFCENSHNAYLTADDPSLLDNDVMKRQEETYVGSIAYDYIGTDTLLHRLYKWNPLKDFIAHVLGKSTLHHFADPLGACSINVFVDGGRHGWHFDESEFTVTLMLQAPQSGGAFEYVPQIRGLVNEKEIVSDVLCGKRERVVELPFSAGTLLIFGGHQTIHRVTQVKGDRPRLVPVLCYSELPDQKNSDTVRQLFWGRTGTEEPAKSIT